LIQVGVHDTVRRVDRRDFLKTTLAASMTAADAQIAAPSARLFPGFTARRVQTSGASIHTLVGGSGPPLLLLHGYPQTHVEWHKIAPRLAQRFTVVMTDLRGYGDSSKPSDGENHAKYSKRAMAGKALPAGHFLPEEVPDETLSELMTFLTR
jgi:haloacetate dehalogenase